jgi:hypothetical protein
MEIDHLKELWQQQEPEKVPENIGQLLGKKSNGPIAKMKRNLLIELIIVVVTYGIVIIYFFTAFSGRLNSLAWVYLFIGLVFIIYFARKNRLLNEMECMSCQVRSNLSKQVAVLEKYVRFYLVAGTAIIPLLALYSYLVLIPQSRYVNGSRNLSQSGMSFVLEIFIWLGVTVLLTITFYYLNKWYVKKLYGNHINKLKLMLEQMED